MNGALWVRGLILTGVIAMVIVGVLVFGVLHHDDGDDRVAFSLTNQTGTITTHNDLAGQHLLVFFGFTSCHSVCPTQMTKLTRVMQVLDDAGYQDEVTPVFISVDPERDSVEVVAAYLDSFHDQFVGLTGSRFALQSTAGRFKTILDELPDDRTEGYQLTHSSIIYVVDPSSRVVDYISLKKTSDEMAAQVSALL